MRTPIAVLLLISAVFAQNTSRVAALGDSNLRGVSAVNDQVVWVSGSKGTIARTTDGGKNWQRITPPAGAEQFDFRDIEAFSATVAYAMSVGSGEQSRIWKTTDGGKSWGQQYTNADKDFFLDSLACWNKKHCVALSDPVGGKFLVLLTEDGEHWRELPREHMPDAIVEKHKTNDGKEEDLKEGAFAASGTAICVFGANIWFGTGGPKARVFHSADRGMTWSVAETPIMHGEASQGIFSITFRDKKHGVIVGGDYKQPEKTGANAAVTGDGGKTWTLSKSQPHGYRSGIWFVADSPTSAYKFKLKRLFAVGSTGADFSMDDGTTWRKRPNSQCNAVAGSQTNVWCVGPDATIQQLMSSVITFD